MSELSPQRRHELELAFFGRIGAHVSHEMRNVLSIVGEYAGLLADLVAAAGNGRPLDCEKLALLSGNIAAQVRKGTETMGRFSRFAHAADQRNASFDLTSLVADVAVLAQRHLARAGCTLEARLPDGAIPVTGDPFGLQHAVFSAVELLVEFLKKGESATIKLDAEGSTAVITIQGSATVTTSELSARISRLSPESKQWKGRVDTSCTEGLLSLAFEIPIQ